MIHEFQQSLKEHPPIPLGAPDYYVAAKATRKQQTLLQKPNFVWLDLRAYYSPQRRSKLAVCILR